MPMIRGFPLPNPLPKGEGAYGRAAFLLVVLWLPTGTLAAPDYIEAEQSAAGDVKDNLDSIDHAFQRPRFYRPFKGLRESLQKGELNLKLRNYYFDRNNERVPNSEAWAQGGALDYDSGWWKNRARIGGTLYTSQKLYGPSDKDGTFLLKTGQKSFTVLGEAFLEAKLIGDVVLKAYRQEFDLPYMNRNDNRMVPNTFEAYALYNTSSDRFVFALGQVEQIKLRSSDKFVSMTAAAGITSKDRGVSVGGFRYTFENGANIGIVNEYGHDFMNIFYTEANARSRTLLGIGSQLSAQYTRQSSVGDELGGDFDTWSYGLKTAASYAGVVLTLAYTSTSSDRGIISPWGGRPSYLSIMIEDFDRADEDAWLIGLSSDFSRFNIKGLSAFINYAVGDTPDNGRNASPDQKELDFTVDYRVQDGSFEGLSMRLRQANLMRDGGDTNNVRDLRAIINYTIPLI